MVTSLGASLVMMYFQLVRVTGQSKVQQSPQFLPVQMGGTAIINCSYTDSAFDYFPWYRQDPGKGPALLIAIRLNKDLVEEGRFTVHLNKGAKYFFLNIKALQPEDSGTYLCAARESSQARVTQVPLFMNIQEGENVSISCNYSSSLSIYLFWYKQDWGKSLELVSALRANGAMKIVGRFRATLNTQARHSSLHITAIQTRDSATYFCTVTQWSSGTCCLGTNSAAGSLAIMSVRGLRDQELTSEA
ncbi:T cell receptor alpha chain MC.7.G5-like [Gracilinanus agilis]|uniref:T cell receptor alpha chain MC.7.G5-like n=1 Tax=Gracilinanus agilis TaxID=191870 RepID=UPI001CFF371E|nr:T cell receptor alpha chain MC.7.G5-like [Gracilinanus agilis]